jgi:hypothetical protein
VDGSLAINISIPTHHAKIAMYSKTLCRTGMLSLRDVMSAKVPRQFHFGSITP